MVINEVGVSAFPQSQALAPRKKTNLIQRSCMYCLVAFSIIGISSIWAYTMLCIAFGCVVYERIDESCVLRLGRLKLCKCMILGQRSYGICFDDNILSIVSLGRTLVR